MKEVSGKTAFITGGASGIGYGMAQAFAAAGMKIVLADIEQESLNKAAADLTAEGAQVFPVVLDVTDRAGFARAAEAAESHFGNIHVLCNNAGVACRTPLDRASYDDWDWVLGVNLGGVVNGIKTFVPRIISHGEGGHVVNTSSIAGFIPGPGNGIYTTSKFAVVGLSETLRIELARFTIGVTVVCPGAVKTNITSSERNRPENFADAGTTMTDKQKELLAHSFDHGTEPVKLGEMVLEAIRLDLPYVLPHAEFKPVVQTRHEHIMAAFSTDAPDPDRVADNDYRVRSFSLFWEK